MSEKCQQNEEAGKTHNWKKALVAVTFFSLLFFIIYIAYVANVYIVNAEERGLSRDGQIEGTEIADTAQEVMFEEAVVEEMPVLTDLTAAFDVILQGAEKEYIKGYPVDDTFLMWLGARFGEDTIWQLTYWIIDWEMSDAKWYEATGFSMHALWAEYCRDMNFQTDNLENIQWMDCKSEEEAVFSFTGDFNFAEGWYTTEKMEAQPNGIYDCFSADLLKLMQESDLTVMNNEFVYSNRGTPLDGKAYTFRATEDKVGMLSAFGVDLVTLANNHTYDYGEEALFDTMRLLEENGITYIGAGKNLEEASKIVYYIANGRKIAIVTASEIERSIQYTKEATADSAGVLKTLHPEKFVRVIEEADRNSDYVIAVPHWGTEGNLYPDSAQVSMAKQFAEAGADAIIGGHPHRLQGAAFVGEVPVAYSLGNFWFTDAALYTTLAQVVIEKDGTLRLKYQPCLQKDLTTALITDTTEMDGFYHYIAAISTGIGLDAEGNVYRKTEEGYPASVGYHSETSTTTIVGNKDNEGNTIDIVGILR